MSGRQGQTITSWLMMIPLLVVPTIAIFGVPKFELLTATNAVGEEPELELELGAAQNPGTALPPMPSDNVHVNQPGSTAPPFSSSAPNSGKVDTFSQPGWSDPFEDPGAFSGPRSEDSFPSGDVANSANTLGEDSPSGDPFFARDKVPSDERSNGYVRPDTPAPSPSGERAEFDAAAHLRWRDAVARLNELGVQKYQLSQLKEPFTFRFECDLTHPDNPRITHRFQAEAGEPLQAVAKVIQQVETWTVQFNNR
ncbi:MAG: hypothetical protein HUJ26_02565 [Planctomycetaceae bacterium]|nr:hypothetical protein [Planctomycetaceae bacterium]